MFTKRVLASAVVGLTLVVATACSTIDRPASLLSSPAAQPASVSVWNGGGVQDLLSNLK